MQGALGDYQITGGRTKVSRFLGFIAESYLFLGELEKATAVVTEAISHTTLYSERFWEAELCRIQGEILLKQNESNQPVAELWLQRAMDVARSQQAKMLELRAALGLSRLWQQQGQQGRAYRLLSEVYNSFTEGFSTPYLRLTRELTAQLRSEYTYR